MVALGCQSVRVAARTTTGTQDVTIAGIGTPKAVRIDMLLARVDNTNANSVEWSTTFYDGTNLRGTGIFSVTASVTTSTARVGSTDTAAVLINSAMTDGAFKASLAMITDGVRLTWSAVDGLGRFLIVTFYYGTQVSCFVGGFDMADNTGVPNQTLDVTAPGFQPDVVQTIMGPTFAAGVTPTSSIFVCQGMAVRTGSTPVQVAMSWAHTTAKVLSQPSVSTSEGHFARLVRDSISATPLTVLHAISCDAFLSTGFRVKDTAGTNPPEVGYLAIRWGGRLQFIQKVTTPTSAGGTQSLTNTRRYGHLMTFGTIQTAVGDNSDTTGGQISVGVADRGGSTSWAHFETDNVTPTVSGTRSKTGVAIQTLTDAGAVAIEATVSFSATNVLLTYGTVLGAGVLEWILSLEQDIGGTGAATFAPLSIAGSGYSNKVAGSGAATFAPAVAAGSGISFYIHVGTAAVAFQPIVAAGVGREVEQGTGAASFAPMSVAGAGREVLVGTGAVTFAPLVGAATGREAQIGAGAVAFAPLVAAGAGSEKIIGSGVVVFAPAVAAGLGLEAGVGSGSSAFAPLVVAGSGLEAILGAGAVVFAPEIATGFGSSAMAGTFVGSGAATFAPFALAGAGLEAFVGAAALVFAPAVFGGAGIGGPAGLSGAGALVFPAFAAAGSGAELVVGASGVLFPAEVFAGAGLVSGSVGGTGALVFPAFGVQGVGIGGIAALTNKKRIYDALVAAARAGLFLRVGYDQGTVTIIEGVPVPPKSVLANETRSTFGVSKRWRRTYIEQRLVWEWELLLQFDKEITAERFERAYCDAPINLPRDPANNLEAVILRLVSSSYSHPPQQQPSNGTRLTYRFVADVHPR